MKNLLRFEYRKLFHSVSFYICGGITVLIALLNIFTLKATENIADSLMAGLSSVLGSSYNGVQLMVTCSGNISYTLLFPIAISIFLCADFTEGTIRNIIGRGYSRTQVFFAKLISGATIATAFYLLGLIVSLILGTIIWGFGSFSSVSFLSILVQLIGLISFSAMFSLLCFVFRKVGGALTLGIFTDMIFSILCKVIDLSRELSSAINADPYELAINVASGGGSDEFHFVDLLLSQQIMNATTAAEVSELLIPLLAAVGYGVLFVVLGYLAIRKKEF